MMIPLIFCGLMLWVGFAAHADTLRVSLLTSDTSLPYKQLSDALAANSNQADSSFRIVAPGEPHDLRVVAGVKALDAELNVVGKPILALMLPQSGYRALVRSHQGEVVSSAVFLDQPRERQMKFIRTVFPAIRKVAVLYSPDGKDNISAWSAAANDLDLTLIARPVAAPEALFSALEFVLDDADVLLATPDNAIYNSGSIRNILLTSYRWRVPMIGFSQGYANAGAVGALFSTPEQIGTQAAELIATYAQTGKLPAAEFPRTYEVAINYQVARSLGLNIPAAEVIKQRMSAAKGGAR